MIKPSELKLGEEISLENPTFLNAFDSATNSGLLEQIKNHNGRALIVVHPFDEYIDNEWNITSNTRNSDFYKHADEEHLKYLKKLRLLVQKAEISNLPIIFIESIKAPNSAINDEQVINRYKQLGLKNSINVIYTEPGGINLYYYNKNSTKDPFTELELKSVIVAGVNLWGSSHDYGNYLSRTDNIHDGMSVRQKLLLSGCVGGTTRRLEGLGIQVGVSIATFPQQMPKPDELTFQPPDVVSPTLTIPGRFIVKKK